MKTTKDLKAMIAQPASKDWFKKHGLPKGLGPKNKAIERMKEVRGRVSKAKGYGDNK